MKQLLLNPRSLLLLICAFASCSTTPEPLVLKTDEYSKLFPYVTHSVTPGSIVGMWNQRIDQNGAPGGGSALLFRKDGTLLNKTFFEERDIQDFKELGVIADENRFDQFVSETTSQPVRNKYAYIGNGVWEMVIENAAISEKDIYVRFRLAKGKLLRETYVKGALHMCSVFERVK